jgi:hypothetical protein
MNAKEWNAAAVRQVRIHAPRVTHSRAVEVAGNLHAGMADDRTPAQAVALFFALLRTRKLEAKARAM